MRLKPIQLLTPLLTVGCAPKPAPVPPDAPEVPPLTAQDFAQLRKPAPTTEQFRSTPLITSSRPAAHYDGRTVAFLAPTDSPAQITAGDGKAVYAGDLRRGEIVLIDPDAGISVAGKTVLPGPLPAGASFDLYLDADAAGQFRTGTVGPPDSN